MKFKSIIVCFSKMLYSVKCVEIVSIPEIPKDLFYEMYFFISKYPGLRLYSLVIFDNI